MRHLISYYVLTSYLCSHLVSTTAIHYRRKHKISIESTSFGESLVNTEAYAVLNSSWVRFQFSTSLKHYFNFYAASNQQKNDKV